MKRLVLDDLLLLSLSEKKARRVNFDPHLTVIKGANDTGKSSFIKSIYRTFGAEPPRLHPNWESAGVSSAARFTLDGTPFRMLRIGAKYALFSAKDELLQVFSSVTKELSPYFAELFNFHLPLSNRKSTSQATPAFLFLPFYMDQDTSWSSAWNSFDRLGQFAKWRQDVAYFHAGLRPSEYYVAKAKLSRIQTELAEASAARANLEALQSDLASKIGGVDFDVDVSDYHDEIETLLRRCNELQSKEEMLKEEMRELNEKRFSLTRQVEITKAAANEFGKDYAFATRKLPDHVECPTCGQAYDNSFAERFAIAQDEDRCRDLLADLSKQAEDASARFLATKEHADALSREFSDVQALLDVRRGEVQLRDVIQSAGKKEVRGIIGAEIKKKESIVGECEGRASSVRTQMKKFDDREHKDEIVGFYTEQMKRSLAEVGVFTLAEKHYSRVDAKISESGSDLPRALLAYYMSILATIGKFSSSAFCPIVIDSPRQQDQDQANWERMLGFIKNNRPEDSQTILAVVDTAAASIGGRHIEFEKKYSVLQASEFDDVADELRPLIDKVS